MYYLGIDVGGTFTDIALVANDEISMLKIPSEPENPSEGIRKGIEQVAATLGCSVDEVLRNTEHFVHGTTVATNAMLQYRGARVALLTTKGFRDAIEMRRCHRKGQWDFFTPQPPMIVPRRFRRGINERTLWDGTVDQPLDEAQLLDEVRDLVENHGIEAIAICFLFSFKNSTNEARAAELIRKNWPDVFVSASHEIAPQIREYERTCTTTVNAFVGPSLQNYLRTLGDWLSGHGLPHEYKVIQSNGGVTTASAAGQHGVRALLSGPAGGAIGGVALAEATGYPNLIVADMGGTSFDLTLVQEKQISLESEAEIAGYMISLPMIGIHTIGAGGGSIGFLDSGGMLRVGPRSAGAVPGPACYGRGGTEPTVTDANVVLGFISPGYFLGGTMKLDAKLAERAVREYVAEPLGLSVEEGAIAIYEVVNSNMVDAINVVTVQQGYDPRAFALVSAGGASPIHAGRLAEELAIGKVIVPKASSVFCALGGLQADMKYNFVRTYLWPMSAIDPAQVAAMFDELTREGVARLEQDGVPADRRLFEYTMDMRYVGQHWDIPVPVQFRDGKPDLEAAVAEFHKRHDMRHGYKIEDRETEVVNLRLMAIGRSRKFEFRRRPLEGKDAGAAVKGRRRAFFGAERGFLDATVYDGLKLRPGNELEGPAIIEEPNTTIVVSPKHRASVDGDENIVIAIG